MTTTPMTAAMPSLTMTTALSPSAAQTPMSAEPAPGSPEALLLLAGLGILPATADFNDPRFAPDTISSSPTLRCTRRSRTKRPTPVHTGR